MGIQTKLTIARSFAFKDTGSIVLQELTYQLQGLAHFEHVLM